MKKKPDLRIFLFLFLIFLFLFLFYPRHFTGNAFVNFDSQNQVYPLAVFVSSSYKSGEIPLWNPYIYSGTPSYADPLYMTFYPGTLLYLIPETLTLHYFNLVELLHIFLGGVSLFLFLNNYKINKWASLSASVVFMLGGSLTGRLQHVTQISAVSLFPLILLFTYLGIKRQKLTWFGLAGFILGCALMIGYQPALLFCFLLSAFFIYEHFHQHQFKKSSIRSAIVQLGFLVIIALGCALIQVMPSIQLAQLSSRPEFTYEAATRNSVPPSTLFTFVFPNIFNSIKGEYWGTIDRTEGYLFNGMIPFFIIGFSIITWRKTRSIQKLFLLILIFSLLYSLGRFTPLYYLLYRVFPPIRLFKRPSDALFIFQLSVAINVGFGLDLFINNFFKLFKDTKKKIYFLLIIYLLLILVAHFFVLINKPQSKFISWYFFPNFIPLGTIALVMLLRKKINQQKFYFLLVLLIFVDITFSSSNRYINSTPYAFINKKSIYACSEIVEFLDDNVGELYRYEAISNRAMWQNSAAIWEIPSTNGDSPLIIKTYEEFAKPRNIWGFRDFSGFIDSYNSPLFDLLGVKYLVTAEQTLSDFDPNFDSTKFQKISTKCGFVYENKDPIPMLYFVNKISLVDNTFKYFAEGPQDDPRTVVVTEKLSSPLKIPKAEPNTVVINLNERNDDSDRTINLLSKTNNKLVVKTKNKNDSILIYNDNFFPGWKVFIDGEEKELLLTNHTFKGVFVPNGEHLIEFVFDPLIFKLGLITYLLSFITVFLSVLINIKKRYQF